MKTSPDPTVTEVDFNIPPADEAARAMPSPGVKSKPPAPFRKRTPFLPVRFFIPKRLPPAIPPGAESNGATAEGPMVTATGETGDGTAAPLPPPEESVSAALAEPARIPAAADPGASAPLPSPTPGAATETVATPVHPPASAAEVIPEPAAPEPPAGIPDAGSPPATPEPAAPVPTPPEPTPFPAPKADPGFPRPDGRGASVQLTFSCEVAALRLMASFQLGDVQLQTLSEVVSLRFIAPREAENPLAAEVAFQIVHVGLDPASRRLKTLLLKPLGEARPLVTPHPRLQVAEVGLVRGDEAGRAPIKVTATTQTSMAVQLFGMFTLVSIHFTPGFGISTLCLEPASDAVLVRVMPSALPTARDLPPSFDLTEASLDAGGRLAGLRLTPRKSGMTNDKA